LPTLFKSCRGTRKMSDPFWKDRSVLITGASGFVGYWLSEELCRQGASVTALLSSRDFSVRARPLLNFVGLKAVEGNIDDAKLLERVMCNEAVDTVFHLAANNINVGDSVSPLAIFETNIRGAYSILEACRLTRSVQRVVIASSREAEELHAIDNNSELERRQRHPYQASKISAELIAQAYNDTYNVPVVISRSDNIYGGRDFNWNRLIPGTIRSLYYGEPPILRSNGEIKRDYVFIQDIVAAYLALAKRASDADVRGQTFHFATGANISGLDIVNLLCEVACRSDLKPIIINHSKNERINQPRPLHRERDILGWESKCQIQEGLRLTFSWYQDYFSQADARN
jgi:CDP-glucose 4,6-dehydratase